MWVHLQCLSYAILTTVLIGTMEVKMDIWRYEGGLEGERDSAGVWEGKVLFENIDIVEGDCVGWGRFVERREKGDVCM